MPNALVISLAKKSGKSKEEVETFWKDIKEKLLKQYNEKDPKFYGTLVMILKRKLGIKDSMPFPLGKKIDDFVGKYRFDIKTLDTLISKQIKSLKKEEIISGIYVEYSFKNVDATVAIDVKGGIEFWINNGKVDYVKGGSFKTEGEMIKIIKEAEKSLLEYSKNKDEKVLASEGFRVDDSSFISVTDMVTSEAVGPYLKAGPGVSMGTTLTKKLVCKKCGFVMPKSKVIEPKSLSCPVCGTSMM